MATCHISKSYISLYAHRSPRLSLPPASPWQLHSHRAGLPGLRRGWASGMQALFALVATVSLIWPAVGSPYLGRYAQGAPATSHEEALASCYHAWHCHHPPGPLSKQTRSSTQCIVCSMFLCVVQASDGTNHCAINSHLQNWCGHSDLCTAMEAVLLRLQRWHWQLHPNPGVLTGVFKL